ncbi:MAG: hypothetical protein E7045_02555 [Lentisphaerae bacterium]|nr:hypothetical protein [Lentisphaerota bacterium]
MKKLLLLFSLFCALFLAAEDCRWSFLNNAENITCTLYIPKEMTVYSESVMFSVLDRGGKPAKQVQAPAKMDTYGSGKWVWRFTGNGPFSGSVEYQRCGKGPDGSDICYVPETVKFVTYQQGVNKAEKTVSEPAVPQFKVLKTSSGYMDKDKFLAFLSGAESTGSEKSGTESVGVFAMFLLALLGGLGLNLTPCVLPMIPINLAIIGASGSGRKSGFIRGLCYGGGMAAAYGLLGVIVILSGAPFGSLNSSWLFNFIIAGVFLILAAAMAGFVNFDLSRFRRFNAAKIGGTKEAIAFVMGAVAALLAGACVAPVVVTVLLFSSASYNDGHYFSLFLPFMLGVGMAIPWPLAGMGLAVLPRPNGRVMNTVKIIFVVLIVAAGAYYIYTGWKLLPGKYDVSAEFSQLDNALAQSRKSGKAVLVDFWAPWCKNCLAMEKEVLTTPEVKDALKKYIFVKFNAQDIRDERVSVLLEKCKVPGLPGYVVIEPADER